MTTATTNDPQPPAPEAANLTNAHQPSETDDVESTWEDWAEYNECQRAKLRPVRPLCLDVLQRVGKVGGKTALDLGAGAGIETAEILRAGYSAVHALDVQPESAALITAAAGTTRPRLHVHIGHAAALLCGDAEGTEPVRMPGLDLIHSSYAAPYLGIDLPEVWDALRRLARPGAYFALDLFGDRDEFAPKADVACYPRREVEQMLAGLDVLHLDEVEEDGLAYSGPKHWHTYAVIARRPR